MPFAYEGFAAVVLSGGRSSRMGDGVAKPLRHIADKPLLGYVLAALPVIPTVVVGVAYDGMPAHVRNVAEEPYGSGPAYALARGLSELSGRVRAVYVLAADLPLLSPAAVAELAEFDGFDGSVYVDGDDRPQWLCGCWRADALRSTVRGVRPGASLRSVLGGLRHRGLRWASAGPPPYFDCDTPEALAEAERMLRE